MPLYDFECPECNHVFEKELPMGSPPPACPECENPRTDRKIFPPPVIFKGDGFYKTDSAAKPKKEAGDANKKEKPESGKKSDTKENKPNEAKKEHNADK